MNDLPKITTLDRLKPVSEELQYDVRVHYHYSRVNNGTAPQVMARFVSFADACDYANYLQKLSTLRERIALIEVL